MTMLIPSGENGSEMIAFSMDIDSLTGNLLKTVIISMDVDSLAGNVVMMNTFLWIWIP